MQFLPSVAAALIFIATSIKTTSSKTTLALKRDRHQFSTLGRD